MRTLLIATIFAMTASGAGQAQENCQLKQFDSISMNVGPDGITVPATVNGVTKDFALSIQNASSSVSADGAKQLGLNYQSPTEEKPKPGMAVLTTAQTFQLGKSSVKNMPFFVVLGDPVLRHDFNIGARIFQNTDLELDMDRGVLNLFLPDHCPGNVVYWTKSGFVTLPFKRLNYGFISVDMELDGKTIRVGLGTDRQTSLNFKAFKRIFGLDETSPGVIQDNTTDTGVKVYHYSFKNLTMDGLNVANPQITIYDLGSDCGDPKQRCISSGDLTLGVSVLNKLHLYISEKEKILYITPAEAR